MLAEQKQLSEDRKSCILVAGDDRLELNAYCNPAPSMQKTSEKAFQISKKPTTKLLSEFETKSAQFESLLQQSYTCGNTFRGSMLPKHLCSEIKR